MSVRLSVVVVEDHDGGDHAAGHHEHDAVKIGSYQIQDDYVSIQNSVTLGNHCSLYL